MADNSERPPIKATELSPKSSEELRAEVRKLTENFRKQLVDGSEPLSLDLTPFILLLFRRAINNPALTAEAIRISGILHLLPELSESVQEIFVGAQFSQNLAPENDAQLDGNLIPVRVTINMVYLKQVADLSHTQAKSELTDMSFERMTKTWDDIVMQLAKPRS